MSPREALVRAFRRIAPGTIARLDDVSRLRQEVDRLSAGSEAQSRDFDTRIAAGARDLAALAEVLEDARRRGGLADDAIARIIERLEVLERRLDEVTTDLQESRRLSLRVAQLADLVFDRLASVGPASGGDVTTSPADR
ncbi:hypothetical protein GCU60_16120 [Blastococcus saxobsidens]|uniref:DUF6752 domain-containing protein n=1 Tax=Blastococcus saxobsidens TaxID=138336 RepID=A0A6L9W657_9ACTN|nr:DUF6752 domain-containing protein [Blastococcus saxobsidens]NEK87269.1 hypothetical protein [Blastococcus saxobsidens]